MSVKEEIADTLGTAGRRLMGWFGDMFPQYGDSLYGSVKGMQENYGMRSPDRIIRRYHMHDDNMRIVPINPLSNEPKDREHLFHYPATESRGEYTIDPVTSSGKPVRKPLKYGGEEWEVTTLPINGLRASDRIRINPETTSCAGNGPCTVIGIHALLNGRRTYNQVIKDLQESQFGMTEQVINPVDGVLTSPTEYFLHNLGIDWRAVHSSYEVPISTRHRDEKNIIKNVKGDVFTGLNFSDGGSGHVMTHRSGIPVGASRYDMYHPSEYGAIARATNPIQEDININAVDHLGGYTQEDMMRALNDQEGYLYEHPVKEEDRSYQSFYHNSSFMRKYSLDGRLMPPYLQLDRFMRANPDKII